MRFPLGRVLVEGPSMAPALRHGDQVVVWWRSNRWRPSAGTVVLVDLPGDRGLGIKRVTKHQPSGGVWVEGDNAAGSTDSRQLGAMPVSALRALVVLRIWPRPGRIPPAGGRTGHARSSH